ncbi:hypothetical protein HOE37_02905 [Candidatus Woesearchaeota archaeon]|jgi:hypothetical protein|nr:hypothetical protein [Candidatus Woesearchaeota archaeon]MBT4110777.1 hypothetical protein [Candidatus Woesearchaeota archaeon]MBT4336711.1 hypothetical protein [Candidatus Woesearchaeota archaeon]MBT4469540.1 hypothetical protein [Candidatus Woesearchaeota archaeon]MBT6743902.1 hypothetical protein [Candidatus Woesearchaeota archaeon]
MNKECHTGRELDCPLYSVCQYNHEERIIANIDPLKLDGSWGYEGKNYSCQKREVEFVSLLTE